MLKEESVQENEVLICDDNKEFLKINGTINGHLINYNRKKRKRNVMAVVYDPKDIG